MRGLAQYLEFAFARFAEGKVIQLLEVKPLLDYETKKTIGVRLVCVIVQDQTKYAVKDGQSISNLYEKINVKIPGKTSVSAQVGDVIELVNPVGTVYGDFKNQLSVTADDAIPVAAAGGKH